MTVWTVEKDRVGWSVVEWRDGERQYTRSRLYGLPCITARVLAAELERAYARGCFDQWDMIRRETLGD